MNTYTVTFSESEMEFFRELFTSKLPITIDTAEMVGDLKRKLLGAKTDSPTRIPPNPGT